MQLTDTYVSLAEQSRFLEACQKGNLVPVFCRIFSDHMTPVIAYRCLVKEDDREAPSFLFESVENGQKTVNMVHYTSSSSLLLLQEDRACGGVCCCFLRVSARLNQLFGIPGFWAINIYI